MDFQFNNGLYNHDDNGQPYSIEVEKDNPYYHLNGTVKEQGYGLTFSGARAYINVPSISEFGLQFNLMHYKNGCVGINENFGVVFGYDRQNRTGYQLDISVLAKGGTEIALYEITGACTQLLKKQEYEFVREYDKKYAVELVVGNKKVFCQIGDCTFEYVVRMKKGKIGFTRENAFREIFISDLRLETQEIEPKKVGEYHLVLPRDNGGVLPYSLHLTLSKLGEDITQVEYTFGDGLYSRPPAEKVNGACWATIYEEITGLYFKLNDSKRLYIDNGTFRVLDTNYTSKSNTNDGGELSAIDGVLQTYRAVCNVREKPFSGAFLLQNVDEIKELCVGYERFEQMYAELYKGAREFIYDKTGALLYNGESLDNEFTVAVSSPLNEELAAQIPVTAYNRADIIHHLQGNHYFYTTQEAEFQIDVRSVHAIDDITVKCILQDAFLNPIRELDGYTKEKPYTYSAKPCKAYGVKIPPLALGVYHLSVEVYYFGKLVKEHHSAFEVLDKNSDMSPQEASGLFHAHVGDGAPLGGINFVPDPWFPMADCNMHHYVDVALVLPGEAEERRAWEIYPLFKRKIFAWMNNRCVNKEDLASGATLDWGITKNADYIYSQHGGRNENQLYGRYDFFVYRVVRSQMLDMLEEFLCLHEDVRKQAGLVNVKERFTLEDYRNFMSISYGSFIDYCLPIIAEDNRKEWLKVKAVNSKAKRTTYGHTNLYLSSYTSVYSSRWFGVDATKAYENADGYYQFEDYPHVCGYSTTRGAWTVTTAKFLDSRIRIFPELYDGWREGCPDAAICPAKPPIGLFTCYPYMCVTQVYEYIFNTPHYRSDKETYSYWKDYGIMLFAEYLMYNDPQAKMDEFLSAWGKAMDNLPIAPQKGSVLLYELTSDDDRFDKDKLYDEYSGGDYGYSGHAIHNISDSGLAYMYKALREGGLPVSGAIDYARLQALNQENCDMVVLPSLAKADVKAIDALRKLHANGVPLIAVHNVDGLEDVFGVKANRRKKRLTYLTDGESIEYIQPYEVELYYDVVDGEVLLSADDHTPILIRKGNTLLLNAPICQVGIDSMKHLVYNTASNISVLLEQTVTDCMRGFSTAGYIADKRCGVTPFVNKRGEDILLLVDYSKDLGGASYEKPIWVTVEIPENTYSDAVGIYGYKQVGKRMKNGKLSAISVELLRQQSVLLKLIK
ncbi:MAG: hypothetical protein IKA88_07180 [Clostridia bacterium]|nr:hypothetical protein [Clostridia bacterium]